MAIVNIDLDKLPEQDAEIIKDIMDKMAISTPLRWIPGYGERYYYIDSIGDLEGTCNDGANVDNYRISVGNCFKLEQRAVAKRDLYFVKQQLKYLAEEYNTTIINWKDNQYKYYVTTLLRDRTVVISSTIYNYDPDTAYFSASSLCDKAIEKIGSEVIFKAFTSEIFQL